MSRSASKPASFLHAVGVDGCAAGWVACAVPIVNGRPVPPRAECLFFHRFADVLARFDRAVVAVDMPIGLPYRPERGGRACDRLARAVLPRQRKSSIFSPPTSQALRAGMAEHARSGSRSLACQEASRVNQLLAPPGVHARIGAQCFGLFQKMAELDAVMTPGLQQRVIEAHPEIIFELLADGSAVDRKKDPAGVRQRVRLLRRAGFTSAAACIALTRTRGIATDDVLDAVACAFTAGRMFLGSAERFGASEANASGLISAIWR